MTVPKLNNVKQTIGFISITIAWALMNIGYLIYLVSKEGKANDGGVIIFWSGLFITVAWAVFIIWPINRLDHKKHFLKPLPFSIITTFYAALAYSIIVGGIFRSMDIILMFLPQALIVGLIFGLSYSLLIKSKTLINLLYKKTLAKSILFLSPAIILWVYLWLMPLVAPSLVYRFMPDSIRQNIIAKTIPKYHVGDNIDSLKKALPGYLDHIENGTGNMMSSMPDFAFVIQVHCGKIIRLEYGENQSEFDGTIYGKLQDDPCP